MRCKFQLPNLPAKRRTFRTLFTHRTGGWDWTDWGENRDVAVIENAWVYLAMKGAIAMAELTDNPQDVDGYRRVMDSLETNFNRVFWQGNEYRTPGYKLATDDRANAMAVVSGLAAPAFYPAIRKTLREQVHASPYMEKYVLEALLLMDSPNQAMDRMKQRYAAMLRDDKTTLWEMFDEIELPGFGSLGRGTYNHAWSGGPLTIMSQYVAGVSATAPAFREYQVAPNIGRLTDVRSIVPTKYGNIEVAIIKQRDSYSIDLHSPESTVATVGVPLSEVNSERSLTVNGKPVAETDATRLVADDKYAYFRVPPGKWVFVAE